MFKPRGANAAQRRRGAPTFMRHAVSSTRRTPRASLPSCPAPGRAAGRAAVGGRSIFARVVPVAAAAGGRGPVRRHPGRIKRSKVVSMKLLNARIARVGARALRRCGARAFQEGGLFNAEETAASAPPERLSRGLSPAQRFIREIRDSPRETRAAWQRSNALNPTVSAPARGALRCACALVCQLPAIPCPDSGQTRCYVRVYRALKLRQAWVGVNWAGVTDSPARRQFAAVAAHHP